MMNDPKEVATRLFDSAKKLIEKECKIANVDGHYWDNEACIQTVIEKMCATGDCPLSEVNVITHNELRRFFLPDTPIPIKERIFDNLLEKAEEAASMIAIASETQLYGYFDGCKLDDTEELYVDDEGEICGTILDGYLEHVWRWKDGDIKWVYSEGPGLWSELMAMRNAESISEKVLAVDKLVHKLHGSGYLAEYFVEGGGFTLHKLMAE